jgi:hypothetical protein
VFLFGEVALSTSRLLLPFTQGVDVYALEYAVMLAKNCNATLIPLSLIPTPHHRVSNGARGARLEHIQQSKDFLVCVRHKAENHGVPISAIEAYTSDSVQHIKLLFQEMDCDGIILFVRDGKGVLLDTHETKHVITDASGKLYIIRLQTNEGRKLLQAALEDVLSWLWRRKQRDQEFLNMQLSSAQVSMNQSERQIKV